MGWPVSGSGYRTLPTWRPVPAELAGRVGQEVTLGLRAEDVHAADPAADPDLTRLTGTVRSIENTGRHAYLTVEIGGHRLVATVLRAAAPMRPGDKVDITVDPSSCPRVRFRHWTGDFPSGDLTIGVGRPEKLTGGSLIIGGPDD